MNSTPFDPQSNQITAQYHDKPQLIEPMIFDTKPEGLFEPMEFFDRETIDNLPEDERHTFFAGNVQKLLDERHQEEELRLIADPYKPADPAASGGGTFPDFSCFCGKQPADAPGTQDTKIGKLSIFSQPPEEIAIAANTPTEVVHNHGALLPEKAMATEKPRVKIWPYDVKEKFLKRVPTIIISDKFYIYNGTFFELCSKKDLARLIVHKCRGEVKAVGVPGFVDQVIDFIAKEPALAISEDRIPRGLVSFQNGILDISTGQFLNHSETFKTLYAVQANYFNGFIPSTNCFDSFLQTVTGGDRNLINRIWEMIGYVLTPDTSAKVFFLLQGVPNSGKSVLTNVISKLFNESAVTSLDAHFFNDKFSISELVGRMLCISPDMPGASLDPKSVSKIKQLTGNDTVSTDVKFQNRVKFQGTARFIFATNYALLTRVPDEAFDDRIVTIPFQYSIPKENRNPNLVENILSEKDGIVSRAILAYFGLRRRNYTFSGNYPPNEVTANIADAMLDYYGMIYRFVQSFFVESSGTVTFVSDAHEMYIRQNGYIPLNTFAEHFIRAANDIFNGQKSRKRKSPGSNAQSCIIGISWRGSPQI